MTLQGVRAAAPVAVTAGFLGVLAWRVDLRATANALAAARPAYFLCASAIVVAATIPLAWRWQRLLAALGVQERLGWLVRSCFVAQAVGQVVPTGVGGDAMRIFETGRRHPDAREVAAGSVLLERLLGGSATIVLGAVGIALASGHAGVAAFVWLELLVAAVAAAVAGASFSARARRPLAATVPLLRRVRLERALRKGYEGLHAYRRQRGALAEAFAVTLAVQAARVAAIWLTARAAGVDLSLRPFLAMGPLLFLVALVPFTVNGLAVRESFFVVFLGSFGVAPDRALATGLLYLLLSVALAIPGAAILAFEAARRVFRGGHQPDRLPPMPLNAWLRYDGIERALRRTGGVGSLLEIGAGTGAIGARLAGRYRYLAVEPDPDAFRIARSRLAAAGRGEILCADVSAVPDGNAFDVVCAFEVLEHLDDDAGALRAWRERVTEGGWIVLSVPAHQHRFGAHDRAVGHFRRYDPDGLSALLVASGFERPTVLTCGFPFGYLLEAVRNLIGRFANLGETAAERTAASGRRFQPPQAAGALTCALSYPFRVLQRPFAGTPLGTALVAVARRSDAVTAG